jgi:hypothetical protein
VKTTDLVKQLELYSNAILAFVVAQSLAFSFTFGTNTEFGCVVIAERPLALGLLAHFVLSTVLAVVAITYLGRALQRISQENQALVRLLFFGKCTVVVIFAAIPTLVLLWFGVLVGDQVGRCMLKVKSAIDIHETFSQLGCLWALTVVRGVNEAGDKHLL